MADAPERGARDGAERAGVVGRDEPNGRGKWRVIRFSRLSMKELYKEMGLEEGVGDE